MASTKPRVSFQDLPLEIIFNIFNILLYSYQRKDYSRPYFQKADLPEDSAHVPPFQWILPSIPLHSRSLHRFPYSISSVSPIWHAVLTKIPECWTRVVFDVADDPGDLLDAFLWSKRLPKLEVHVFTTATHREDISSAVERRRVTVIVNALRPHVHRCRSIVFDVMYHTSLPPPVVFMEQGAPDLERVVLDCQVDNIDDPQHYADMCDIGVYDYVDIQPPLLFPKLRNFSMTAFWFMRTWNHPYTSNLFERLPCSSLSITQFQFRNDGVYTLRHFVSYFARMCHFPAVLQLRGLSLDYQYDPSVTRQENLFGVFTHLNHHLEDMTFDSVSPDFISTIFAITEICPLSLHFERCIMPSEVCWEGVHCPISFSHVDDKQIANSDGSTMDDFESRPNVLDGWPGERLTLISCRSFDDDFIDSLRALNLTTLKHLTIQDCNKFSAKILCRYIQARNKGWVDVDPDVVPSPSETHPLHSLSVSGDCSFPSNREQLWIQKSGYTEPTTITWESSRFDDGLRSVKSCRFHGYDSD